MLVPSVLWQCGCKAGAKSHHPALKDMSAGSEAGCFMAWWDLCIALICRSKWAPGTLRLLCIQDRQSWGHSWPGREGRPSWLVGRQTISMELLLSIRCNHNHHQKLLFPWKNRMALKWLQVAAALGQVYWGFTECLMTSVELAFIKVLLI